MTIDVMFDDPLAYQRVRDSGILTVDHFAALYGCRPIDVRAFASDRALGFKFSVPRPCVQGDLGDGDLHGGQQFAPLVDLEIPG